MCCSLAAIRRELNSGAAAAGICLSKHRYLSAQMGAYCAEGHIGFWIWRGPSNKRRIGASWCRGWRGAGGAAMGASGRRGQPSGFSSCPRTASHDAGLLRRAARNTPFRSMRSNMPAQRMPCAAAFVCRHGRNRRRGRGAADAQMGGLEARFRRIPKEGADGGLRPAPGGVIGQHMPAPYDTRRGL